MRARLLVVAAATLLLLPAAARADDASLFAAYNAQQPSVDAAARVYAETTRAPASRRAYRATIRADRGINRALLAAREGIEPQAASTPGGTEARTYALAEIDAWVRANRFEMRALRALLDGRRRRADRLYDRANRTMLKRTFPNGKRAVRRFATVGLESPEGAISGKPPKR